MKSMSLVTAGGVAVRKIVVPAGRVGKSILSPPTSPAVQVDPAGGAVLAEVIASAKVHTPARDPPFVESTLMVAALAVAGTSSASATVSPRTLPGGPSMD